MADAGGFCRGDRRWPTCRSSARRARFGFLSGYAEEEGFTAGAGFYLWSLPSELVPGLAGPSSRCGLSRRRFAAILAVMARAYRMASGWRRVGGRRTGRRADRRVPSCCCGRRIMLGTSPGWSCSPASCRQPAMKGLTLASFLLYLVSGRARNWYAAIPQRLLSSNWSSICRLSRWPSTEAWRHRRREPASDDEHGASIHDAR